MDMEELGIALGRIDTRLEKVESACNLMNEKLFTGNGDAVVTRLRLVEQDVVGLKNITRETRKGRFAIIIALATGLISMITSVVVAFVGK